MLPPRFYWSYAKYVGGSDKALGNAVVPQLIYELLAPIAAIECDGQS